MGFRYAIVLMKKNGKKQANHWGYYLKNLLSIIRNVVDLDQIRINHKKLKLCKQKMN